MFSWDFGLCGKTEITALRASWDYITYDFVVSFFLSFKENFDISFGNNNNNNNI